MGENYWPAIDFREYSSHQKNPSGLARDYLIYESRKSVMLLCILNISDTDSEIFPWIKILVDRSSNIFS
jgi:hypothetical protein